MNGNAQILLIVGGTGVLSFVVGYSRIFEGIFVYFSKKRESHRIELHSEIAKREQTISKQAEKIEELNQDVISQRGKIQELEQDMVQMSTYLKTLLAYLETLVPQGASPFIKEMAKEIRQNERKKATI